MCVCLPGSTKKVGAEIELLNMFFLTVCRLEHTLGTLILCAQSFKVFL